MTSAGKVQLEWTAPSGGLYALEVSSDLSHWERSLTLSCNGGFGRADDLAPAQLAGGRFYRLLELPSMLGLSTTQVSPGHLLNITGNFDPALSTWVGFRDSNGQEIQVRTDRVKSNAVSVIVPPLVKAVLEGIAGGAVAVTVQQLPLTGAPSQVQGAGLLLEIGALPPTGLPTGAIALAWLDRLSILLGNVASEWELLGRTSEGTIDTERLLLPLLTLQTNVDAGRQKVLAVVQNRDTRFRLGDFEGRQVDLDYSAVAVFDRLLAAFLSGTRTSGGLRLAPARAGTAGDPMADLDAFFDQATGPDSKAILNCFDRANIIAAASVGILASAAVVLGAASAPAAVAMAGTAGAVLFFTAYVGPAVMAVSSQALVAPFIEVQAGRPVPSLDDYRSAMGHLQKGSLAYLTDEVVGRLVRGIFTSQNASDEITSFFELYVNTSRSLLSMQDLERTDSVGSTVYSQAPELFAKLKPSETETSGTYVGALRGSATETYPDAGWRHEVSGTLKLVVHGQGTVANPYYGSLTFLGQNQISLVFCHSSVGCDPGGTINLRIGDGDLYGAHGSLEGEGIGDADGTWTFSLELTEGQFQGSILNAAVHLDLGVDQPITTKVSLNRVAMP